MAIDNNAFRAARVAAIEYGDGVLKFPNVIGYGVGKRIVRGKRTREIALVVFVSQKLPLASLRAHEVLPRELKTSEGTVVIDVVQRAMPRLLVDSAAYRPLRGGCEISPAATGGAGTLGAVMYDRRDAEQVLLTNNHVLTAPGQRSFIPLNAAVNQPAFGGVVGRTKRIVPWLPPPLGSSDTVRLQAEVDAGIVSLDARVTAQFRVIDLGRHPYVPLKASMDLEVSKRGRTTDLTTGTVNEVNICWVMRDFNGDRVRIGGAGNVFSIQSPPDAAFALQGDSGSLVVDSAGAAARGLVFSGDMMNGGLAYASDLITAMEALELETPCTGSLDAMFMRALRRRQMMSELAVPGTSVSDVLDKTVTKFRAAYFKEAPEGTVGAALERMFQDLAHELAEALALDEDFAGLMDLALGDWLVQPTVFDMLEYQLPNDLGSRLARAFDRLREVNPDARGYEWVTAAFDNCGGLRMRDVLTRAAPRLAPKERATQKRRSHARVKA
jgi:hypothetical protein